MFEDLLMRMLTFDPDRRITPEEALKHPFFSPSTRKDGEKMQTSPRGESSDGEGGAASSSSVTRQGRAANMVDQEVQTGQPGFLKSLAPSRGVGPAGGSHV